MIKTFPMLARPHVGSTAALGIRCRMFTLTCVVVLSVFVTMCAVARGRSLAALTGPRNSLRSTSFASTLREALKTDSLQRDPDCTWTTTFADDFDGTELDASKWRVHAWYPKKQARALFTKSGNLHLADGALHITTKAEHACDPDGRCAKYTSGWVQTQGLYAFERGRVAVRAKLPTASAATGVHASHWMMPDAAGLCWPTGGELDIMEHVVGNEGGAVVGTYHWGAQCNVDDWPTVGKPHGRFLGPTVDYWSEEYHTFELEWSASQATWKIDGVPYYTYPDVAHNWTAPLPTTAMFLILDTQVSDFVRAPDPSALPVVHSMDWVVAQQCL